MTSHILIALLGLLLVVLMLRDAFEQLVLPQTVRRPFGPARVFYRITWGAWSALAGRMAPGRKRERNLSVYGPLSLLLLLAVWGYALILGFAMVQWGIGSRFNTATGTPSFGTDLYMSGTTFFTLGLGDVTPNDTLAQVVTVIEAGTGFGFLAIVVAYLPVLYGAFSHRELSISLLDARASSPPTAEELLRRLGRDHGSLERMLGDWERWAAELMESHLSYPALGYYRSQHQNQSWIAALTSILDISSLTLVSLEGPPARQARLTFAIARHAVVDLAQVFGVVPRPPARERLTPEGLARLREWISKDGTPTPSGAEADRKLSDLRRLYEPYVNALGTYFLMAVPGWMVEIPSTDNWRTSAWEKVSAGVAKEAGVDVHDDRV
jgi:hypothetical protein